MNIQIQVQNHAQILCRMLANQIQYVYKAGGTFENQSLQSTTSVGYREKWYNHINDAEETFNKTEHPFMIKISVKLRI